LMTVTARRDRAGMMIVRAGLMTVTARPGRAGMMIVRAGLMTVTGRRDPAVMMTARPGRAGTMRREAVARAATMTGRPGRVVTTTGRRDRAGMTTVRAGSIATTAATTVRAATMTGPSGRSASRAPRRNAVRRRFAAARAEGAPTSSPHGRRSAPRRSGWTKARPRVRAASRPGPGHGPPVARRRVAAKRCGRSTR
jgi:hypothetical protein